MLIISQYNNRFDRSMSETISLGQKLKQARKDKGYSQTQLAKLVGIDFTYLSKIENNHADYSPKEVMIRGLACHLELDPEELTFLAGRLPSEYEELIKTNYQTMPALFRRIREQSTAEA